MKKFKKIYIEITNACNLSCSFCSKTKRKIRYMTTKEFEHIINEVKEYTNYIYLHVKGEPLLHPEIIEFLHIAEQNNLKVNLTTNGTLFKKLVPKLKECKALHKINFSLHCETTDENYLESIFDSVNILSPEVVKIYRLWALKNSKIDKKTTKIVDSLKRYYKLSTETVEKIITEKNIKLSSTIYVDKDDEFDWPKINSNKTCGYCHALKTHLAILVDGTVVPCCLDAEGIINLGNIHKTSLKSIVSSDIFNKIKKSFQDRKPIEDLCKSCTYKLKDKQ